jgi:hypothetical protein
LLCTGVPVVGRLQARRERRRGLQVPGGVIEVSSDVVGELRSVCGAVSDVRVWMSDVSCPLWRGGSPPFYTPMRGRITSMPHYSATWGSMVCSATELAAALTVLATI